MIEIMDRQVPIVQVRLAGRIQAEVCPFLENQLLSLLDRSFHSIELHCCELTLIDSTTISMFIRIHQHCTQQGGCLSFQGLNPRLRELFELSGLGRFFGMDAESI